MVISSILRTTAVSNSVHNEKDITYNFIRRGIWTLIEANLGIICACLPVLKKPLARLFPRIFDSTQKPSGYGGQAPEYSKQYQLRNVSQRTEGLGTRSKNQQTTSITRPMSRTRKESGEERIITNSPGQSDSELDDASFVHNVVRKHTHVSICEELSA